MVQKSKLPDIKEITTIAGKLFTDIKKSVTEIVQDYKAKREEEQQANQANDSSVNPAPVSPSAKNKEAVDDEKSSDKNTEINQTDKK